MPRSPAVETRSVGRAQAARPQAGPTAHRHAEGERGLAGALSVPVEQVTPDPDQPRKDFDPGRLDELADSLRAYGVLQPLIVREAGLLDDGRTRYTIVAGERRYRAATLAGLTRLPVLVRDSAGVALRILQLTENIQREALHPVEEARAFRELMDLEAIDLRGVAGRIHRSHTYVADRLKLIAHEDVASAVMRGALTTSAATEVARERDRATRQALLERAAEGRLQKRDVQRLRRERRAEAEQAGESRAAVGGMPTLREVAAALGASEAQVRAAAEARQDAPDLTPAEALTLVMSAEPAAASPRDAPMGDALPDDGGAGDTGDEGDELAALVAAAGGASAVLRLLDWAQARQFTLADLCEAIERTAHDDGSVRGGEGAQPQRP